MQMTSAEPVVATVATAGKRTGGAHCTARSLKAEARSRAHMSASCSPVSVTRRGEREHWPYIWLPLLWHCARLSRGVPRSKLSNLVTC